VLVFIFFFFTYRWPHFVFKLSVQGTLLNADAKYPSGDSTPKQKSARKTR